MDKATFIEKWIPFIGLGVMRPDEARAAQRRMATSDLDSLSAAQWWRKWGEHYHGWPGGAPKRNARKDLVELLDA